MKEVELTLDGAARCTIHVPEEEVEDLETYLEAVQDRIENQQTTIERLYETLDYYHQLS